MKLSKAIKLPSGRIVPAGTKLHFGNEGFGYFEGETIYASAIPQGALEAKADDKPFDYKFFLGKVLRIDDAISRTETNTMCDRYRLSKFFTDHTVKRIDEYENKELNMPIGKYYEVTLECKYANGGKSIAEGVLITPKQLIQWHNAAKSK